MIINIQTTHDQTTHLLQVPFYGSLKAISAVISTEKAHTFTCPLKYLVQRVGEVWGTPLEMVSRVTTEPDKLVVVEWAFDADPSSIVAINIEDIPDFVRVHDLDAHVVEAEI